MSKPLRLLVVEDNPADSDFTYELLPEAGGVAFQIEAVTRLSEAIARLARKGIDLVLLDLGLPDSAGLPTFHRLRAAAPDVPVIVLTGTDDQELAIAAVREGAQDYLIKGQLGAALLIRAIRYAVERERLIAELRAALTHVKILKGLLPICSGCKKIRDGQNRWHQLENYIKNHSQAEFTHGLCPDCVRRYYPEMEEPPNPGLGPGPA